MNLYVIIVLFIAQSAIQGSLVATSRQNLGSDAIVASYTALSDVWIDLS